MFGENPPTGWRDIKGTRNVPPMTTPSPTGFAPETISHSDRQTQKLIDHLHLCPLPYAKKQKHTNIVSMSLIWKRNTPLQSQVRQKLQKELTLFSLWGIHKRNFKTLANAEWMGNNFPSQMAKTRGPWWPWFAHLSIMWTKNIQVIRLWRKKGQGHNPNKSWRVCVFNATYYFDCNSDIGMGFILTQNIAIQSFSRLLW